jgi:hypothetical protein
VPLAGGQGDATLAQRRRAAARAGRALLLLLLSSVVGLRGRPLECLQGPPLLELADSGLLRVTAAPQRGARRATPVSAHGHFRRQTWCCESGFHQSRSLRSIPFRGAASSPMREAGTGFRERGAGAAGSAGRTGRVVGDEAVSRGCRTWVAAGPLIAAKAGAGCSNRLHQQSGNSVPALSCRTQNELDGDASRSCEKRARRGGRGCSRAVLSEEVWFEIGPARFDHYDA